MCARDTLRRSDILRGYGSFLRILSEGENITARWIKCFYLIQQGNKFAAKAGFSVSRSIKKAAIRNRVKRLMREAYRVNRHMLTENEALSSFEVRLVFLYTGRTEGEAKRLTLLEVEHNIRKVLSEIRGGTTGGK